MFFFVCCLNTEAVLECHSCNSLGIGESHTNDACVKFDKTKIGTEPCQVPEGKVGKCQTFQGSVTVTLPLSKYALIPPPCSFTIICLDLT